MCSTGFWGRGLGFRHLGTRVQGSGLGVSVLGVEVRGLAFECWLAGCMVQPWGG